MAISPVHSPLLIVVKVLEWKSYVVIDECRRIRDLVFVAGIMVAAIVGIGFPFRYAREEI